MKWSILIWDAILIASAGTLLLRIGGRKSISQMTTPQIAMVLIIGSVLGSDLAGNGVGHSILATGIFLAFLGAVEWVSLNWNFAERILKGRAVPIIADGKYLPENMKRLRMTTNDIEKRMRMVGIHSLEEVKSGTIENNGELGIELQPYAKHLTRGDLEELLKTYFPQVTLPERPHETSIFPDAGALSQSEEAPGQLQ
ncbi:uncharacterized membrane protein YcaP (DUF421 family) [Paenibacillus anaericanus]|uniref:DUF421 domain-containing protein n=1 Tax=Paenibacillus anaericanus TaxID=170367 RepID=UPI002784427B|nr:YetF domain-containing protein [Paenibacillus anaericanus]MDQ0086863.1 uncharacterized membrane protein YcaP (DUF421 family) [Paenibacillus anaericanus]